MQSTINSTQTMDTGTASEIKEAPKRRGRPPKAAAPEVEAPKAPEPAAPEFEPHVAQTLDQMQMKVTQAKALGQGAVEVTPTVMAAMFGADYDKPYAFYQSVMLVLPGQAERVIHVLGTDGQVRPSSNIRHLHRERI